MASCRRTSSTSSTQRGQAGERIGAVDDAHARAVLVEVLGAPVQDVEQQRNFQRRADQHGVLRGPAVRQDAGAAQRRKRVGQVQRQEAQRDPAGIDLAFAPGPDAQSEAQQNRQQTIQVQQLEGSRAEEEEIENRIGEAEQGPYRGQPV
jgi:hypothetical protein